MKTIKILVASLMVLVGFAGVASQASASQLKNVKVTLGDTRPNPANTTHVFAFQHTSTASLKKMTFQYCKAPSGTCDATSTNVLTATKSSITGSGITNGNWSITNAAGIMTLYNNTAADGDPVGNGTDIVVSFANITNGAMGDACDATVGTDTCFVRINTYQDSTSVAADDGVASYTLVDSVIVTAKVDPTFTFVVSAVAANVVNNQITTSVLSTSNTLPFGSLQAGTPKYAAHDLKVTTNTQGGYTVSMQMSNQMTGIYSTNNIDPFAAPWATATTWTEPTGGTPNDNTGWIGANTTDQDVTNWTDPMPQKFGGVASANIVSQKSSSDNGTVGVVVTYAIEANVFQPSDAYSGQLTYNALPTY